MLTERHQHQVKPLRQILVDLVVEGDLLLLKPLLVGHLVLRLGPQQAQKLVKIMQGLSVLVPWQAVAFFKKI